MLYHFSEDPGIVTFRPRISIVFPQLPPVVWAIDPEHAPHYYFPRDCPRVIYWLGKETTAEDRTALFAHTTAQKIIVVEKGWFDRIRSTPLYIYTFEDNGFECFDANAGYYIAKEDVHPVSMEAAGDLLERLMLTEDTEIRFATSLYPIRDQIVKSSAHFSIIRFSNAGLLAEDS